MKFPLQLSVTGKCGNFPKNIKEKTKPEIFCHFPKLKVSRFHAPSDILRLGDIVLSYPQVINDAVRDEMLVDDKVDELVEHGIDALLGLHHE